MNTAELELEVLGALRLKPSLLGVRDDLDSSLFSSPRARQTFEIISAMYADDPRAEIDEVILAGRLGGGGSIGYISALTAGRIKISEEAFSARVVELRKRYLTLRILKKIEAQARSGEPELEEVRKDLEAIDALKSDRTGPPHMVLLSSVEAQPVSWLWPNFIPIGKATMISGDPGVGKTWLALDVSARLSKGLAWPDGSPSPEPANAIYFSVEDQAKDTLRPRIDSLGGDPDRVGIINPICPDFVSFAEKDGINILEQDILKLGNVRLVVLDPILDFSGEINPNAAEQVRAFLTPLIRLGEKYNLALVLTAHLNKAQAQSAIYRTGGSTSAWLGKCRAAFMIFRDNEEKKKRYVSAIKSNLAPDDPPQLSFVPDHGRLIFEKVVGEIDVDEHLNPQLRGQAGDENKFNVRWLLDFLKDGPKTIKELADEVPFSRRTLFRLADKLEQSGKIERAPGTEGKFKIWRLPE